MGIGGKKGKGRGKGGGGHIQIQNIEELEMQNAKVDAAKAARRDRRGPSDDEESDSDKEDEGGASESVFDKMERLEKQKKGAAPKPAKKLNGGGEKTIKNKDIAAAMAASPGGDQSTGGMNKKEREADAANKAKEAYMLKTLAGETEEARRNLEKLALVRKRREEAKTKREAEGRAPGADAVPAKEDSSDSDSSDSDSDDEARMQEKKAKAAQKLAASKKSEASKKKKEKAMAKEAEDTTGSDLPVLKSIDIKKMNPAAIKDALKERGESTQGQKKDLIKRLTDFEAARA